MGCQGDGNKLVEEAPSSGVRTSDASAASNGSEGSASGTQTCTQLIRNVACDVRLVSQLSDKRTLTILTDFVKTDSSFTTRLNCAITLAELSRHKDVCAQLVDNGGIALAWSLLQVSFCGSVSVTV